MYELNKVKNYKQFAELLEEKTGCSIKIQLMEKDGSHVHYQLNDKYDMSLGVLCVNEGDASFAPFETLDSARNDQYINFTHLPQADDMIKVIGVLKTIFVEE